MNILVDALPTAVMVAGQEFSINTDYRASLRTILAFEDEDLTQEEKTMVLLTNLYPELPGDLIEAFRQGVRFLNGGKDPGEPVDAPRLYSFGKDAPYIFAAFRQTHGLDLATVELHWWSFLALFMDLGQDTTFCQLVSLRKRVKTGTATKEERKQARELGDIFDIPETDTRTTEEREQEAEFMRLINGGGSGTG